MVATGRTALVARLRAIAARVEALPLVAVLEREASLELERSKITICGPRRRHCRHGWRNV